MKKIKSIILNKETLALHFWEKVEENIMETSGLPTFVKKNE